MPRLSISGYLTGGRPFVEQRGSEEDKVDRTIMIGPICNFKKDSTAVATGEHLGNPMNNLEVMSQLIWT